MSSNIQNKILKGLASSMSARVISMAIRIISVLLLPFWLTPSELGYTALLLACINLPIAFADLGFGTALIKFKDITESDYQAVYTLNIITALCLFLPLIVAAPNLANFLSTPLLEKYLPIAAWAIPFSVFAFIPNAKLQKDLRFVTLAKRDFFGELAYSLSTVILAAAGFGAYSVAIGLVLHRFVRFLLARIAVDWKPRLRWQPSTIKKLFGFSAFQSLSLIFTQLFYNLDKILLATFLSPAALGFYNLSYQVGVSPVYSLMGTAQNVFFATFSKIQENRQESAKIFKSILKFGFLLPMAISAVGLPWIYYLPKVYGEEWTAAIPVAQLLFACSVIISMDIYEGIVIAVGKVYVRVISSLARLVLMVAAIFIFQNILSPTLVAAFLIASALVAACINLATILKSLHYTSNQFFSALKQAPITLGLLAISLFLCLNNCLTSFLTIFGYSITCLVLLGFFFRKDFLQLLHRHSSETNTSSIQKEC